MTEADRKELERNWVFLLIPSTMCQQTIIVERMGYDRHSDS